ncbi:MAG: c-type cytochrome [Kiloniellales bacterium]|nr:c-type cytochrome [Kiloniellales bacterium]
MKLACGGFALRLGTICLALLFLFPPYGHAQSVMVGDIQIDPQDFSPHRDPQTRVAKCLACHGEHAGGDIDFGPDVQFGTPALRGMRQGYLKQSLIDYKSGRRPHEEMGVIASMLDEETIDFMARTFAAYPAPPVKTADELAKLAEKDLRFRKGQAIAQEGVPEKEVPACMSCHGASGEGDAELGPRLAGQNSIYIQQQFAAYADKSRRTDQAEIMQPVAAGLSRDEIKAIAYYYQQLIHVNKP